MRAVTNIFLYKNDEKIFGEGPCRLLHEIEVHGSLRAAAIQMNLSYSKAIRMVRCAEEALGFALTEKTIGGKGGGGSRLTEEAKDFLKRYEAYRNACREANQRIYKEMFGKTKIACIIMASGVSRRFGKNKLLVDFHGQTLIERVLKQTDGELFSKRIVLTRTKEVEEICKNQGIEVLLHECEGRGEAIRLGMEKLKCEEKIDGCIFVPCDQPFLHKKSLQRMVDAFAAEKSSILQLGFGERKGTPVLFAKEYFEELMHLPEKSGGSYIIRKYPDKVKTVEAESILELEDIDTNEDYERLLKRYTLNNDIMDLDDN